VKWQHSAEREVTERDTVDSGVYGNRSEHIVAILLLRAPLTCSDNDRPYHQTMNENDGTLKMRDIKQWGRETTPPKCRGGNSEN